jgi:hypothetical protein
LGIRVRTGVVFHLLSLLTFYNSEDVVFYNSEDVVELQGLDPDVPERRHQPDQPRTEVQPIDEVNIGLNPIQHTEEFKSTLCAEPR